MNKSFCPMAFKEIYTDNSGQYRLCCHAKQNNDLKKYNSSNTLPFEFFTSEEMENIRNDMFEGKLIDDCEVCYNLEKLTGKSHRILKQLEKYGYDTELKNIGLKLRINGSYCNLGCYMCHPYNSSTRRNELKTVFGPNNKWQKDNFKFKSLNKIEWKDAVADILKNINLIDRLHLTGGEPLLLPKMWELVELIPGKYAKDINLTFDTNLTKLNYKSYDINFLINKFKSVSFSVSCDHYGQKLAWMRYPINVSEFEENLVKSKHIISQLACTVSLLNINDLNEIESYYKNKFNLKMNFDCIVSWPKELSIRNLPEDKKNEYIEKYSHLSFVVGELKKSPYKGDMLKEAEDYLDKLSTHRNFNWRDLWK